MTNNFQVNLDSLHSELIPHVNKFKTQLISSLEGIEENCLVDATNEIDSFIKNINQFFSQQRAQITGSRVQSDAFHKKIQNCQFNNIIKAFSKAKSIRVYSSYTFDGENAQITWQSDTKSWLITSLNVSLLANNVDDIVRYSDKKFTLTSRIAKVWFDQLKIIENSHGSQRIQNLQKDLTGRILIGTLVGSQSIHNLVRYDHVALKWFNITNSKDNRLSAPILQVLEFLNHYYLEAFEVYDLGVFQQFDSLNEFILNTFDYVAQSDIETGKKGSILYIQSESQGQQPEIISILSLKTLEYKILNKLQCELIRYTKDNSLTRRQMVSHFSKEIKEICKTNKPARNLDFYTALAELAFDFVDKNSKSLFITDRFVDLISVLYHCKENKTSINSSMLLDLNLQKIIRNKLSSYDPRSFNTREIIDQNQNSRMDDGKQIVIKQTSTTEAALPNQHNLKQQELRKKEESSHRDQAKQEEITKQQQLSRQQELNKQQEQVNQQYLPKQPKKVDQLELTTQQLEFARQQESTKQQELTLQQSLAKQSEVATQHESDKLALKQQELHREQNEIKQQEQEQKKTKDNSHPKQTQYKVTGQLEQNEDDQHNDEGKDKKKRVRHRNKHNNEVVQRKHELYNPQHLPYFLGIYVNANRLYEERAINKWVKDCLDYGDSKFSKDLDFSRMRSQWLSCVNGIGTFYEICKPMHLTTLFIGGQGESVRQLHQFKEFEADIEHTLYLSFLIASPDNLITAIITPNTLNVEDPYPHMNLYTSKLKSKDSNQLIAQSLAQDHESKSAIRGKQPAPESANKIVMNFRGRQTQVYIICVDPPLKIYGVSRAFDK